ncbi:hypothetical protein [Klebsiella pneumoniae IS53]|nr:hypothetical protein [Klebsiella pneumoniae IS53]
MVVSSSPSSTTFFLPGKLIVQTEKMTCLMVRFHSDSFILFWFQGQTR